MAAEQWADQAAMDAWLAYLEGSRGRKARTIEAYRQALGRLREYLAGTPLVAADPVDLETFTGLWLHKKGVVARSRKPYISAVKGFYAWLKSRGAIRVNVAAQLEHPATGRPLPKVISLANAEKLMWGPDLNTFVGIRDAAILSVLIGCGLRVSGLTSLNESNLQTVEIKGKPRLVISVTEKGERQRLMPVPQQAELMLRIYLGHEEMAKIDRTIEPSPGKQDKVLFVSVRSTKLPAHLHYGENRRLTRKAVDDLIKRHGKRAGVPDDQLHAHAMRHLFGTELTEEDVPTVSVADLLGHADIKSTAIYTHLAIRKRSELLDKHGPIGRMKTPVSELLKRLPS